MKYIHETAILDPGAEVGENSKIWHFTHVMPKAKIATVAIALAGPPCSRLTNAHSFCPKSSSFPSAISISLEIRIDVSIRKHAKRVLIFFVKLSCDKYNISASNLLVYK